MTAYFAAMARFHDYSFGNVMLIAMQRPDATHVAGFQTWKTIGRFVKKGEHGIVIIAPMAIRPKENADGALDRDVEDARILRFKAVYVFDVSQTEGEPLPEFATVGGYPNGHTDRLRAFVAEQGIALEFSSDLGASLGRSHGGRISLREGLAPAAEFSVLVHELAHELLHRRDGQERPSKTVRETEAEAVAFVVCQAIGLETGTAASDYIQLYDGDTKTLGASLDRIQKTAAAIIQAVTDHAEE
jgi:antirestriction protein ArdC